MAIRADQAVMSVVIPKKAAAWLMRYANDHGLSRSGLIVQLIAERIAQLGSALPDVAPATPAFQDLDADETRLLHELIVHGIGVPVAIPPQYTTKRLAAIRLGKRHILAWVGPDTVELRVTP